MMEKGPQRERLGTGEPWWLLVAPPLLGSFIGVEQVEGDLTTLSASPSSPQCGGDWKKDRGQVHASLMGDTEPQ